MLWTNFSHCLGQKHDRKPKIEKFEAFFHPVKAVQSFTTQRTYEKESNYENLIFENFMFVCLFSWEGGVISYT